MTSDFKITSTYKFYAAAAETLPLLKQQLERVGENGLKGLIIISPEGCNLTVAGLPDHVDSFKEALSKLTLQNNFIFKDSFAGFQPFRRLRVDIRPEIVTLKQDTTVAEGVRNNQLTPEEWHEMLSSQEDIAVLDVRNFYETQIGIFKDAIDLKLKHFSEFPLRVSALNLPKEKKILMYCTGGIRCEKAIVEMQEQGYQNVFQLEGGILKYFETIGAGKFNGECFVFDHRVAVDSELHPSKQYSFCPHCGNPAAEVIECLNCSKEVVICSGCGCEEGGKTCSKNCRYHYLKNLKISDRAA